MAGKRYKKIYTRENSLLAFQVWAEQETNAPKSVFDWYNLSTDIIYDVNAGVGEVYYRDGIFARSKGYITRNMRRNKDFVRTTMRWYGDLLDILEKSWKNKKALGGREELIRYYYIAAKAWCGLSVSYHVPTMRNLSKEDKQLAMRLRERGADFLDDIDHVIVKTLKKLYPELGEYARYVSIDEVKSNKTPKMSVLRERSRHYIYFGDRIFTGIKFDQFLKKQKLIVRKEKARHSDIVRGQTAMKGIVVGRARVVLKKAQVKDIRKGEVLVATMTTPDYVVGMRKAAAFVTDEGGITCHAAILARELKKPCIIGTSFATHMLKNGDMVEVDADKGTVRILKHMM
ncbi:MAG: hypothetical protein KGH72_02970 [Candidatus Micrarchaeota archaeon]|nr:hypothetical protein [Candidatus Micrarchaeota archaeon]